MNCAQAQTGIALWARIPAYLVVSVALLYLLNNFLVFWRGMPGPYHLFSFLGWLGDSALGELDEQRLRQGWMQVVLYLSVLVMTTVLAIRNTRYSLREEALRFQALAAYLVRAFFWAVLLIGFADMLISFLRVENLLHWFFSDELALKLGRPSFRGSYLHFPLLALSFALAALARKISFPWLALLVVLAEFQIVVTRFVFSYEQVFMGDLVRFWYAALFLFASAHTLVEDGHVRVDVLYSGFSPMKKAWSNILGSLLFGIPLCWVILMQGMGGRSNSINSPLLSFEISQSAYGMYVKYLMAGFLVVFAVTMLLQFVSLLLSNIAVLTGASAQDSNPRHDRVDASASDNQETVS